MAKKYIKFTTVGPMTWSQVSQHVYGSGSKYQQIIAANPNVSISALVPAGTVLFIPVLPAASPNLLTREDLPPWKR